MAEITASMVKELRERTGAGMMDCKNALVEAGGDMAKAAEVLEKKRKGRVEKAAGKIAADGLIVAAVSADNTRGAIVEVNSQTDFVARGEDFQTWANHVAQKALEARAGDIETLEKQTVDGKSLREIAEALTAKSGEKHAMRRVAYYETKSGVVTSYIHAGSRLGVLVELKSEKGATKEAKELADEIALQIAGATGTRYVSRNDVAADSIAKQREIFVAQMKSEEDEALADLDAWKARMAEEGGEHSDAVKNALKEKEKKHAGLVGRPQATRDKILEGKVATWLKESVLLDQVWIKDSKKTIAQLLADASKAGKVEVARFERYELGEGIEKGPTKDFATEVAEMAAASQKQ
jgi:elongation factor Ts